MFKFSKSAVVAALSLAALWMPDARAAGCAPADAKLAGHYQLHGMMEMGSEILLRANGNFQYALAYGALDELAEGCWSRKGQIVTLVASKFEASGDDPAKFTRLELKVTSAGELSRQFGPKMWAEYSRR